MAFDEFKTAEMQGWDARARLYDDYTGRITTQAIPTLLEMAETAPGMQVLDLCCGTGRAAGAAEALGAEAEGIDVAPAMVSAAMAAFPAIPFAMGDAEAIPREAGSYDAVIWSFGLMHVGSPEKVFSEIARVLRPGGRVALSHWVGPPESDLFRIVFGTLMKLADMTVVPPSPPPFALSSEEAMGGALEAAGFGDVEFRRLPLVFRCPADSFGAYFRNFAARAAVILDRQAPEVLEEIEAAWAAGLEDYAERGELRVPMPALAVSAVRTG